MDAPGTILSAVVTYKGELFESNDDRYNTMFDYYWYRIDSRGDIVDNIYLEDGTLKFINTKDPQYTPENDFPRSLARTIDIEPKHIENKATFTCDLLDKRAAMRARNRIAMLRTLPLEDEIRDAEIVVTNAGLSKYDYNEVLNVALEMRAFTIAQEEQIISTFKNRGE